MTTSEPIIPRNNLGLYRLQRMVAGDRGVALVDDRWDAPEAGPLLVTGSAGSGKSSLITSAAWHSRGRFPGGIIWVSAAGREPFRLEDIYFALDAVLGTSILIQPLGARAPAALSHLDAEPRLLVLDELEQLEEASSGQVLDLVRRIGAGGKSKAVAIAEEFSEDWRREFATDPLLPPPLQPDDVIALADSVLASESARDAVRDTRGELTRVTGGNPLLCRLALGLVRNASTSADVAAALAALERKPIGDWLAAAEADLRRSNPAAAALLAKLAAASAGASIEVIAEHYWTDSGEAAEASDALSCLTERGLLARGRERVYLHPAVRQYLARQPDPACDQACLADLERQLTEHYLGVSARYSTTPYEQWAEYDADWPNIRHFANLAVERLEAQLGRRLSEVGDDEELPAEAGPLLRTVEEYALRLLPLILRRHPRASRRWLSAGRHSSRLQGHPHRAAQLQAALGGLCYVEDEPDEAVRHFTAARKAFEALGDLHRLMRTKLELASVLRALERYDEAIDTYHDAVRLAENAGAEIDRATAYARLGAAYLAAETPFQAIDWLVKARQPLEREGGPALAALLNNLGLAYEAVGRYRDAIDVYQQSFHLIEPSTQASQSEMSTIAGNIGAVHYELGELEEALNWYRRDLALTLAMGDQAGTATVHHNLGHVLLEMGIVQGAIAEFTSALRIYERLGLAALAAEEEQSIAHARLVMAQETTG